MKNKKVSRSNKNGHAKQGSNIEYGFIQNRVDEKTHKKKRMGENNTRDRP